MCACETLMKLCVFVYAHKRFFGLRASVARQRTTRASGRSTGDAAAADWSATRASTTRSPESLIRIVAHASAASRKFNASHNIGRNKRQESAPPIKHKNVNRCASGTAEATKT